MAIQVAAWISLTSGIVVILLMKETKKNERKELRVVIDKEVYKILNNI